MGYLGDSWGELREFEMLDEVRFLELFKPKAERSPDERSEVDEPKAD